MRVGLFACSALLSAAAACAVIATIVNAETTTAEPAKPVATAEVTATIDQTLAKVWAEQKVTPAKPAGDEEFLRRVYFDTVGVPPTAEEAAKFLDDKAGDKRAKLVDAQLADARFGRHMADQWVPILMGRGSRNKGSSHDLLAVWMAEQFNKNRDFGQVAYDIITASGGMSDNLAVAYWAIRREQKVADYAGLISKQFTGVQIQCAQCHTHPYEKWTMEDFAGVASFFQPVQIRSNNNIAPVAISVVDQRVRKRPQAEKPKRPEDVRYYEPKYLGGESVAINDSTLWRSAYAKWVIGSENTQTHRYLVNRFWSFLFGSAFVNPVDDFNSINKVQHPELLETLARDFAASKYDVKRFYRIVMNSRAYQLAGSGAKRAEGAVEAWMFAEYPVRQLSPEQLFGALVTVAADGQIERDFRREAGNPFTAIRNRQGREGRRGKDTDSMEGEKDNKKKDKDYDEKSNAVFEKAIEDMTDAWFLRRRLSQAYAAQSSDDEMTEVDGFSMTIDQALMVMNGLATQTISGTYKGSCLQTIMAQNQSADERVKALFLRLLTRKPTAPELSRFTDFIARESRSRKADDIYADVLMALLMTTEFATNH
ncbi:MAG: DUF1549 domain-containing protein [Planctomycetes bacterium]|nr:DUF1549 domain-containing protein [Planctomycetota bacterium]